MLEIVDAIKPAGRDSGKELLVNFSPRVALFAIGL
jgi:hypothetical protein